MPFASLGQSRKGQPLAGDPRLLLSISRRFSPNHPRPNTSVPRVDSFPKVLDRSAFVPAFIFAATPFLDSVIFIPLGKVSYSPTKTFISLFSGKFVLTLLVAYLARSSSTFLDILLGGSPIATAVSVGVVVVIAIIMMRVDWEKVLARRHDGIIRRILRRIKYALRKPKPPSEAVGESTQAPDSSGQT